MLFDGKFNRPVRVCVLVLLSIASLSACNRQDGTTGQQTGDDTASDGPAAEPGFDRQTAFRVRGNRQVGLNADDGWAADVNRAASVEVDRPFRLRFEVEASEETRSSRSYRLEVRRNDGQWAPLAAENFPNPEKLHEFDLGSPTDRTSARRWRLVRGGAEAMSWHRDGGDEYLRVESKDQRVLAVGRYRIPWQPREFAVELRLSDEPRARAGIVFDYRDPENHARVELLAPDTIRIVRIDDGELSVVAERAIGIDAGRWLELKTIIDRRGHQVDDGGLSIEFDDETLVFPAKLATKISTPMLGLYLPERSTADFRAIVIEGEPRSPRTSIVASKAFDHGAPTQDLLSASGQPFAGGAGVSFAEQTPPWSAEGGHGEWEFPIVVRRFSDRAALNEAGDRFDYRLVDDRGITLATKAEASVTVKVPKGHLGGTFVETPMRIGPWQAENGDLYFLMEPAETWNALMTVRSSDAGESWREVDGAHRPQTGDLEGFGSVLVDDRIHMLHQTSDSVRYHAFNTADHPGAPDVWAVRDEHVASPPEPPTQVADIAVRSEGSLVAVYGGPDNIRVRIRSPGGRWSEERMIDGEQDVRLSGPTIVRGRGDTVHLAYTADDGSAWYRRILPDGTLTEPAPIAFELGTGSEDVGSILPLLYMPERDSVSVIYRNREGRLHARRVDSEGNWSEPVVVSGQTVVQNSVDSDQTGADAIAHGDRVHVLFIEDGTGRLFHVSGRQGRWGEARLIFEDEEVQWVRGSLVELPNGRLVYGYVFDAGSDGGSGKNRYAQIDIEAPRG